MEVHKLVNRFTGETICSAEGNCMSGKEFTAIVLLMILIFVGGFYFVVPVTAYKP